MQFLMHYNQISKVTNALRQGQQLWRVPTDMHSIIETEAKKALWEHLDPKDNTTKSLVIQGHQSGSKRVRRNPANSNLSPL